MKDIVICNMMRTLDFPYDVAFLYPYELHNEKILKDNIDIVSSKIMEYIKENELLGQSIQILRFLKFESQQEKQKSFIDDCKRRLKEIIEEFNKDIKPYYWEIIKDTYDNEMNMKIKANYVFFLKKY